MAGLLRSLISTAAGRPVGESIRRYSSGVLGGTLRVVESARQSKRKEAEAKRGRLLKEKKETEDKRRKFKEDIARQEYLKTGKEREARGIPPQEPEGFLEREKSSKADIVYRKLLQRERRREEASPLLRAILGKMKPEISKKEPYNFEKYSKKLEEKYGTPRGLSVTKPKQPSEYQKAKERLFKRE